MIIIIPERIESITTGIATPHQASFLWFVFSDDVDVTCSASGACGLADLREHVRFRVIENLLRGVEAETIKMEFLNPIARVGDKEFAHGAAVLTIEIDGFTPFAFVLGA